MSVENLKEYARRCATEPELRAMAKEFGMGDMDQHMRQARRLDLDWTRDDLVAFRKEAIDAEGDLDDLGEEELEQVAGGVITTTGIVAVSVAVGIVAGVGAGVVAGTAAGGTATASGDGGW